MTRVFAVGVLFVLASVVGAGGRAAADAPVAGAFHDHFFGPDPCTGTLDEITVTGTAYTRLNEGAVVVTSIGPSARLTGTRVEA